MGVGRSELTRSAVVAGLTCAVGTAISVAVNFATTEGAGRWSWIAVILLTLLATVLTLFAQGPSAREPTYRPRYDEPRRHPAAAVSWVSVIVSLLLIVGITGAVVYAASYAVSYLTGHESGTERLVREVSKSNANLTLTVHSVEVTAHFTKVELTATNQRQRSLSLPLFMNCQLNAGGTTLSADSFRSDWPTTVPAGQSTRGTIVFNGRPEASAIRTTLSFATVYGDFAPPSISVPDILLRDPTSTEMLDALH